MYNENYNIKIILKKIFLNQLTNIFFTFTLESPFFYQKLKCNLLYFFSIKKDIIIVL